jgi:hypothetical protein
MSLEILGKDYNGNVDWSLPPPDNSATRVLSAGTVKSFTVPTATPGNIINKVFFSFAVGTNVFVTYDGSSPDYSSDNTINQELNPGVRQIKEGMTLKFKSDTSSWVVMRFDQGQS